MLKVPFLFIAGAYLASLAFPIGVFAASVSGASVPLGSFSVTIAAGGGTSGVVSVVSFPLQPAPSGSGQLKGLITAVASNSLSNSNGGWTPGQFSQPATPYVVKITSGAAAGRTFLVSTASGGSNSATTLTIDPVDASLTDLTTLGIVSGTDTYEIIPADTISSIFGTPTQTGVLGGANSTGADQVQLYSPTSGWAYYYYNLSSGWTRVGPPIPSGNTAIRPDAGIVYLRYATTPMTLVLTGRVPSVQRQAPVGNSGISVISNDWPVDLTLASSNISSIPNWVSSSSSATADLVQIYSSANGWSQYFYNGTNWIQVGPPRVSDGVVIPAGSAVIIVKRGSATGQSILSEALPYSI